MKKLVAYLVFGLMVFASPLAPLAPHAGAAYAAVEDAELTEFRYRIKRNEAFLEAARKIVRESGRKPPIPFIEMAEALSREAYTHFDAGEKILALEDISDATRLATIAITVSTLPDDRIKSILIEEELALKELRERARKEGVIGRRINEVEVFIGAAERLLAGDTDGRSPGAAERVEAAKSSLASAREELQRGNPDAALASIERAYAFATRSVKEIKRSRDEVITFPPAHSEDPESVFSHELKKNDTYLFFASQVVEGRNDKTAKRLYAEGREMREAGLKAREAGRTDEAISALKGSTEKLVKAIKLSTHDDGN